MAKLKRRTLPDPFDDRPTWLANAQAALDRALWATYGWGGETTDEVILGQMIGLNGERARADPVHREPSNT